MSQNRFQALAPEEDRKEPVGRDSKRHLPAAPKHGRQYDRNSQAGERRFPSKGGYGRGGWGNPKDVRPPREETAEQKARREEREKEHAEMLAKHEEYLNHIQSLDDADVKCVGEDKVEIIKVDKMPEDLAKFKKTEKKQKREQKQRNCIMLD